MCENGTLGIIIAVTIFLLLTFGRKPSSADLILRDEIPLPPLRESRAKTTISVKVRPRSQKEGREKILGIQYSEPGSSSVDPFDD